MQIAQETPGYQQLITEASASASSGVSRMDTMWLDAYLDHLRTEKGLSSSTIEAYASDLARFSIYIRKQRKSLSVVTEQDVSAWFALLKDEGMSSRAQARKLSALRGFFRFLVREQQLSLDPSAQMDGLKTTRVTPKTLAFEEVELLLRAPDRSTPRGLRDHAMIQLMYASGLRVSELVSLGLDHVSLADCTVFVSGRGTHNRVTPCGENARNALAEYLKLVRPHWLRFGESEHFFITERGRRMTRQGFWKLLGRYARVAGIEKPISPHQLRHSFAKHMLDQGADLRSVQQMMGNADAHSMLVYFPTAPKGLEKTHKLFHPIG